MLLPQFFKTGAVLAIFAACCLGQDSTGFKLTPKGQSWAEAGQVVKGHDKNSGNIEHVYFQRIYLTAGLNLKFSERTFFKGGAGVKAFNEFPRDYELGRTRRYYYYLFLDEAELNHTFIENSSLKLNVGGGYFHYKYNNCSRNLGEYLFRSTAYPQTIITEFDFPKARLAGLYSQGSYNLNKSKLSLDVIAFTNTEWMAIGDLNIAALAAYNISEIFEIGAGVMFGSVISADEKTTTPSDEATKYIDGTDTTKNYTFRGTKLMARASLDPKKFFPSVTIFGKEDLKLYTEAALLGVKNYDVSMKRAIWYNSILERIPIMVGFNFPVFKILDVLSVEGEWWGNRYPNSMHGIVHDGVPLPFAKDYKGSIDSTMYKDDNIKWSIFGEKTFAKHYRVSFQAASDHMRTFAWEWMYQDWEESLRSPDKWYFVVKFGILF